MKNKLFLVLLFFLSIPTFSTLFRSGYFPMHDDMQAMRLLQLDKCVQDMQIPCRWVPDMGYGYGYPQFNYYSPLPYYAMEAFHLVGFGILDSVKIGFAITIFISALGMYLLGNRLWGRWGGALSSLLFIYAPYRAVDMYARGAVAEFWALSFLPFIFWSLIKIKNHEKNSILYLALSLSSLFLSHNVTVLIAIPFFAIFVTALSVDEYFTARSLSKVTRFWLDGFIASVWGFGISAFFLLPAYFEKKYVHIETLVGGYFDYRIHFVSIKQLLFNNFWGYGGSDASSFDEIFLGVGAFYWLVAIITFLALAYRRKYRKLYYSSFFIFMALASLFMAHSKSSPIWSFLSFLEIIQFPWRFLSLATFAFSLSAGGIISFVKNKKVLFASFFALLMLFYGSFFRPKVWFDISDQQKFEGASWTRQQTISIFDYLPKSAEFPPASRAPDNPQILEGEALVENLDKHTNWVEFSVNVSQQSIVQVPLYYFPGWQVYVDGEKHEFRYDNELGLITIDLAQGNHKVLVQLEDTPVRQVGNILSLVSILVIFVYIYKYKQ